MPIGSDDSPLNQGGGSTEQEKAGLNALPFFIPYLVCVPLGQKCMIAAFKIEKLTFKVYYDFAFKSSMRNLHYLLGTCN